MLQIYNLSSARLASAAGHTFQPTSKALRVALKELADVEMELAGARLKTSTTALSLDKLREEAEAYSYGTGRLEAKERTEPWLLGA